MSSSDKRRAHGVTGNHVLRTASSARHAHHNAGPASGSAGASASAGSGAGSHLPAVPQRVAVVNASAVGDDTHDAADKDKDKDEKKETTGTSGASTVTRTSSSRTVKDKHRERDRDRESASLAAQVKQKDERIAYLEREMDTMEREFQHQLDKMSANESETATFWQSKHSAIHHQYLRTDTELRLLRVEVDVREAEREELRQGWDVLRREMEVLRREVKDKDEENRGLREQVRGLKEFVSTSTRADGQTSDEVFGDGMARLGNGLQNWVISHFRKVKPDLSKLDDEMTREVSMLVPMYEDLAKTAKVHFLQSVVSRILVDMIFDSYFVGLSKDQTNLFRQMEQLLSSFCGEELEPVNQWRASTLTLLRREAAPQVLHDDTTTFAETVVSRTNHILDALTGDGTAVAASNGSLQGARDAALRVLVNNSIELARLLVVQKAVLRVYMPQVLPHQRMLFEPSTMEDIGGSEYDDDDDGDGLVEREVGCVVFPGVVKRGNEHGAQMQYRNVICKAKVICRQD